MRTWDDLEPGDLVVEQDGHRAVFVILGENQDITTVKHWDVLVLYSEHPRDADWTRFRRHWIRCNAPFPPRHDVFRGAGLIRGPWFASGEEQGTL